MTLSMRVLAIAGVGWQIDNAACNGKSVRGAWTAMIKNAAPN